MKKPVSTNFEYYLEAAKSKESSPNLATLILQNNDSPSQTLHLFYTLLSTTPSLSSQIISYLKTLPKTDYYNEFVVREWCIKIIFLVLSKLRKDDSLKIDCISLLKQTDFDILNFVLDLLCDENSISLCIEICESLCIGEKVCLFLLSDVGSGRSYLKNCGELVLSFCCGIDVFLFEPLIESESYLFRNLYLDVLARKEVFSRNKLVGKRNFKKNFDLHKDNKIKEIDLSKNNIIGNDSKEEYSRKKNKIVELNHYNTGINSSLKNGDLYSNKMGNNSDLDRDNHYLNNGGYENTGTDKNNKDYESLFNENVLPIFIERLNDVNFYVRVKSIHLLGVFFNAGFLKSSITEVLDAVGMKFHDKTVNVRKRAICFFSNYLMITDREISESNPTSKVLSTYLKKSILLLKSKINTELNEILHLIKLSYFYKVKDSPKAFEYVFDLVWDSKTKKIVLECIKEIIERTDSTEFFYNFNTNNESFKRIIQNFRFKKNWIDQITHDFFTSKNLLQSSFVLQNIRNIYFDLNFAIFASKIVLESKNEDELVFNIKIYKNILIMMIKAKIKPCECPIRSKKCEDMNVKTEKIEVNKNKLSYNKQENENYEDNRNNICYYNKENKKNDEKLVLNNTENDKIEEDRKIDGKNPEENDIIKCEVCTNLKKTIDLLIKNIAKFNFYDFEAFDLTIKILFKNKNFENNIMKMFELFKSKKDNLKIVYCLGSVSIQINNYLEFIEKKLRKTNNENEIGIKSKRLSINRTSLRRNSINNTLYENTVIENTFQDNTITECTFIKNLKEKKDEASDCIYILREKEMLYNRNSIFKTYDIHVKEMTKEEDENIQNIAYLTIFKMMACSSEYFLENIEYLEKGLNHKSEKIKNSSMFALGDFIINYSAWVEKYTKMIFNVFKTENKILRKNGMLIIYNLITNNLLKIKGNGKEIGLLVNDQKIGFIVQKLMANMNENDISTIFYETACGINTNESKSTLRKIADFIEKEKTKENLYEKINLVVRCNEIKENVKEILVNEKVKIAE